LLRRSSFGGLPVRPRAFGGNGASPGRLEAIRVEPGGHGFNRVAFARQQQAAAVVLQGLLSVPVPRGFGQALQISRQALFLPAWPRRGGSTETIPPQIDIFMPQ